MTGTDETKPPELETPVEKIDDEPVPDDRDSDPAMRGLLKRATAKMESEQPAPDLLPAVQRKIRKRSRGKFFADGWSTTNMRINYTLIAIVMLSIILIAYVALGPTGISR